MKETERIRDKEMNRLGKDKMTKMKKKRYGEQRTEKKANKEK